ncbi:DMT family transporter [Planotetraspora sp. A-T 1434]|uniref:DMT family transporter n=1 Tax=Planotetraspora sp. A-T 1434 TaxID=2979219 RepID=UPI0021C1EA35|nr:DMT family transporter [Planotetraspora sp. A-T 1434]MCT9933588.1 DMT family transporter [Planotetraspora sp. A-T 1434]
MTGRAVDWLLALAGGVLLTLMTLSNAVLARYTDAVYASWAAHGLGALVALILVVVVRRGRPKTPGDDAGRAPLWYYLGGIPGAFVVIVSAVAVNSELALAGTIALMLTGQVVFGIVSDRLGLLRIPRRRITAMDLLVAGCVLAGSVLIVLGGA